MVVTRDILQNHKILLSQSCILELACGIKKTNSPSL